MQWSAAEVEYLSSVLSCDKKAVGALLADSSIAVLSQAETRERLGLDSSSFAHLLRTFRMRAEPVVAQTSKCLAAELPDGRLLITDLRCWWKYLKYRAEFVEIVKLKSNNASFISALVRLDKLFSDDPLVTRVMSSVGWRLYCDLALVQLPYWGGFLEVPPELSAALFRSAVLWQARNLNPAEFDAVVEIGCGVGGLIVSLALEFQTIKTRFVGTDFSSHALKCTTELGRIAGVPIETYELDLKKPNFRWLKGCKRLLVIGSGVLCSLGGPPVEFFDSLIDFGASVKFLLFEPIGPQVGSKMLQQETLPSSTLVQNREISSAIWDAIEARSTRGELNIDRVVPDFASRIPSFPMSLLEMSYDGSATSLG